MFNRKLLKTNPSFLCAFMAVPLSKWRAFQSRRRSERALSLLDDRLLNDVGLCRLDDGIVPIDPVADRARSKSLAPPVGQQPLYYAHFIRHRRHE